METHRCPRCGRPYEREARIAGKLIGGLVGLGLGAKGRRALQRAATYTAIGLCSATRLTRSWRAKFAMRAAAPARWVQLASDPTRSASFAKSSAFLRDLARAMNVAPFSVARWESDEGPAPTGLQAEVLRALYSSALSSKKSDEQRKLIGGAIIARPAARAPLHAGKAEGGAVPLPWPSADKQRRLNHRHAAVVRSRCVDVAAVSVVVDQSLSVRRWRGGARSFMRGGLPKEAAASAMMSCGAAVGVLLEWARGRLLGAVACVYAPCSSPGCGSAISPRCATAAGARRTTNSKQLQV